MSGVVVFEHLRPWMWLALWWSVRRRRPVYILRDDLQGRQAAALARYEAAGQVRRLALQPPLQRGINPAADRALDLIAEGQAGALAAHPLVLAIRALTGSDAAVLAFQKSLCLALERVFFLELLQQRIAGALAEAGPVMLVPARPLDLLAAAEARTTVRVPLWVRLAAGLVRTVQRGAGFVLLLSAAWRLAAGGRRPSSGGADVGIAIVSPAREFTNEIRGVDFLLDGERLRADNTLFIPLLPLGPEERDALGRRGLRVSDPYDVRDVRTAARLAGWAARVGRWIAAPPWLSLAAAAVARDYVVWTAFLARSPLRQFVTYADFGLRHYGRNLAMARRGVATWYYADATNTSDAFELKPDGSAYRHPYWAYLYYDVFVSWGARYTRYMQRHAQRVGRYEDVGCLWSEHIAEVAAGRHHTALPELLRGAGLRPGMRVVAVFDSTYDDATLTTYDDGAAFAEGLLGLLAARDDLFIVFKEKKTRATHPRRRGALRLLAAYAALDRHPRCLCVGHRASGAEVIAAADLTVAFPFSSTTLEALGARRRGLWFDPHGKYGRSLFASIPGLVAAGQEEFIQRVVEVLEASDHVYGTYLDRYLKGDLDPYLDARGLSRFRALLPTGRARTDVRADTPALANRAGMSVP